MPCNNCSILHKSIINTPVISGAGTYPSTLHLAYMVNLEYYVKMDYRCIHEIPESENAIIKVKDLVKFLDDNKWQMGTRTSNEGTIKKESSNNK